MARRPRRGVVVLALACLMAVRAADAQPPPKIPRIGVFGDPSPSHSSAHLIAAFREGLRDLGYVEGRTILIEWRSGPNHEQIATEMVRRNVDIILPMASTPALAAKQATRTIPIVMISGDPIADGLVTSLSRPGGNITGLATLSSDIVGKQLELLKLAVPRLSRVAVLSNPDNRFHPAQISEAESATRALGAQHVVVGARSLAELPRAFAEMATARVDGLLVLADGPLFLGYRRTIADLATRGRLPSIHPRREHVEAGGLLSYGTDRREVFRRVATYVDKILKGARPGDLPVEQASRLELVVNLKTAKALGLTIPPTLLERADHVIK